MVTAQLRRDSAQLDAILEDPRTRAQYAGYVASGNADAVEKYLDQKELIELLQGYLQQDGLATDADLEMDDIISANISDQAQKTEVAKLKRGAVGEEWGGYANVVQRMNRLELAQELDDVLQTLAPNLQNIDSTLQAVLDTGGAKDVAASMKTLVSTCLDDFFRLGFSGLEGDFLDRVAPQVQAALLDIGTKGQALQTLDFVFSELAGAAPDQAELSKLVLPMVHMVARGALETVGGGEVEHDIVIDTMMPAFLERKIMRPFYSDKMVVDLSELLTEAQGYSPDGSLTPANRQSKMYDDYGDA